MRLDQRDREKMTVDIKYEELLISYRQMAANLAEKTETIRLFQNEIAKINNYNV